MPRFALALTALLAGSLSAQAPRIPESAWLEWRTLRMALSPDSSGLRWWVSSGDLRDAQEFYGRFEPRAAEAWVDSARAFLARPLGDSDTGTVRTSAVLRTITGDGVYLVRRKHKSEWSKEKFMVIESFDSDKPLLVDGDADSFGEILDSLAAVSKRTPFSAEHARRAHELTLLDENRGKQVKRPQARKDNVPPQYPLAELRSHTSGSVVVSFVVSSNGKADVRTVDVLHATNSGFLAAVLEALPRLFFAPAEVDGRSVRHRVVMPFSFTVER